MSIVRNCVNSAEELPIKINISGDIKDQIREYAVSDLSRELGGVLVGSVSEISEHSYELNIEHFIIAEHTDAHLSSVTFTAETWSDINKKMDADYSDLKIVGWFHTHPGFGIFLSNWDIFIQDNFFNLPWQIAYVIDPCHKIDGFFIWKNQDIVKITENTFEDNVKTYNNKYEEEFVDTNAIEPTTSLNKYINIISESKLNQFINRYSKPIIVSLIIIFLIILILHFGIDSHINKIIKSIVYYFKDIKNLLK